MTRPTKQELDDLGLYLSIHHRAGGQESMPYSTLEDLARNFLHEITLLRQENDSLLEEVKVARERLGPAGYRILQEVVKLRKAAL